VKGNVLVAGFTTRHVARSAAAAGYRVTAVDHFCDQDLSWYTDEQIRFDDLDDLPDAIEGICQRHRFDFMVVTSGAETVDCPVPLMGTPAVQVEPFLDKGMMQEFFEGLGMPVPPRAAPGTYPVFLKPLTGAGGWRNAIVHSNEEERAWEALFPGAPYLAQEIVDGVPASVSCIGDGSRAVAVAVNRQVMRGGDEATFGFSGSMTPFETPMAAEMIRVAEQVVAASGCVGSVGVDFIVGDDLHLIEINPRFQGTVDTVETATGWNLFDLHVAGCEGRLPVLPPRVAGRYAVRSILFAEEELVVTGDLSGLAPIVADIPWPGTVIEEGGAIVSVYGQGPSEAQALASLDNNIITVRTYMSQW
jgi:predicted ATP-grasp superfamily ATP-dependent carboligase